MKSKDEIKVLCIGGPYDQITYYPEVDKYMTLDERKGYYQYQCQWHKQMFIWIWGELLPGNPTPEYWKKK